MSCTFYFVLILLWSVECDEQDEHHARHSHKCINNVLSNTFNNCTPMTSQARVHNSVCNKHFRISVIDLNPYSESFQVILTDVLRFCCGHCVNYTATYIDHERKLMTTDILQPVLSYTKQKQSHGHYFIPILDVPVGYYFRHQPSATTTTVTLIKTCLRLWPLGTICLMMALIAGFIVWSMETWINFHQFPRPFLTGVFEGFWWSFISMTTVGYGDKYPKTCFARIFAVIWILIGITVCSMFTASLTSAITSVEQQTSASDMSGKRIGVLHNRKYDSLIVIRHGGTPVEMKNDSSTVPELVKMMEERTVDGIFLDKYVSTNRDHLPYLKEYASIEMTYDGEQLSYGILVMNESDYVYFNEFIRDNRITLEACVSKNVNTTTMPRSNADYSVFSENMFLKSFLGTGGIIAVLAVLGFIYEIKRRKGKWTNAPRWCRSTPSWCRTNDEESPKLTPTTPMSPGTKVRRGTANSTKGRLNQTTEELTQIVIGKDLTKLIKKWKADGMV